MYKKSLHGGKSFNEMKYLFIIYLNLWFLIINILKLFYSKIMSPIRLFERIISQFSNLKLILNWSYTKLVGYEYRLILIFYKLNNGYLLNMLFSELIFNMSNI